MLFLRQVVERLHIDVLMLQEIWHPEENSISIRNYTHKFIKTRIGKEGGGVAIITHKNVKAVQLKGYDIDHLEVVWVDLMVGKIRTVVGSVYIPPGDIGALDKLDSAIGKILQDHDHLVIGMDANSRSSLWDESCISASQYQKSMRMGSRLEEIIGKHAMCIRNSGAATYVSGNWKTAPDVTLSKGMLQYGNVTWSLIDDEMKTPHEGIIIDIGEKPLEEVIDWKNFDWALFKGETSVRLQKIKEKWLVSTDTDCDEMVSELTKCIQQCVDKVAEKKVIV